MNLKTAITGLLTNRLRARGSGNSSLIRRPSSSLFQRLLSSWFHRPAVWSLSLLAVLAVAVFVTQAANTENDFTATGTSSVLVAGNWSLGHVPNISEDAVFNANTGIRPMNAGNLTVGSFNLTAATGTYSIRNNTTTSTDSV